MDDFDKKFLSKSSPNNFSSGNNENESENQRNLQQKNKNFMSPTISAASKFTSPPKSTIFNEWKPQKSDLPKLGYSNSTSRKSLPRIPSFSSPKNAVNSSKVNDHFDDDAVFVPDSFDVPYDPLTNYLSPRPKFLRYRPNRKRQILEIGEEKSESESNSLNDTAESSVTKDNEEVVVSDERVLIVDEDVDEDEFEGGNRGFNLIWVLFKCLIVFFALRLCTSFICSMNSSSVVRKESKGFKFGDEYVMNTSLRVVSLRSVDDEMWEYEFLEKLKFLDYYKMLQAQLKDEDYFRDEEVGVEEGEGRNSMTELKKVKNEAPRIEDVVDLGCSEVVIHDSEAEISGVKLDSRAEIATDVSEKATKEESRGNSDIATEKSEAKSVEAQSADDKKEGQSETVEFGPTSTENQSENAVNNAGEDFNERARLMLTLREMRIWSVILPVISLGLLSSLVFKFYCKCKRASSRTRSSNVKLCRNVGNTSKSRHGLPPKAVEKTAPLVQKEVNPPLSINPQNSLDSSFGTIIPKVKKLGEFEVGVEFTQSLKQSCSAKTEIIHQNDETVYSTPDIVKRPMRRSSVPSSGLSAMESYSQDSYISQDTTSVMKDNKEGVSKVTPTPRRSTRLRDKGMTSP